MVIKQKILQVTPFFPPDIGGISIHVNNICKNLKKYHNISVIAPKNLFKTMSEIDNSIYRLKSFYLFGWPYSTLKSVSIPIDIGIGLKSLIKSNRYDLIHIHGHHYPLSWIAINIAKECNIPTVLTLHGMYALNPKELGGKSRIEDIFNNYIFRKMLKKVNAVIGLTDSITDYAQKLEKTTKYYTIPNGVNTQIYKDNINKKNLFKKKLKLNENRLVLLFCGRLESVKGIMEFTEAINQLSNIKNFEILIVGEGTLANEAKTKLASKENVHFYNWQLPEKIHEFFIASDVFILPSKFEALPLTVIEAMNANLHIIYTPVGGVPDILKGYNSKSLLKSISPNEIKNVIESLSSTEIEKKQNSDSLVYAQNYDWEIISNRINELYDDLIDNKKMINQ